jgi:tetratricopeptide (TPR) repeat protein
MQRVEKTVFISYRRANGPWALAIFQNLKNDGYDVFIDYEGIPSGDFERVIVENIRARAHFLLLLTPSALERCSEPDDLFRREIEAALDSQRNIVPLMLESFDFGTPAIANQLTGKLEAIKRYNALRVPVDYFMEAMSRLREQYLNVPLSTVIHPASSSAQKAAAKDQAAAAAAPVVEEKALTAQQWFEQGFNATDLDEKLRCYSEAIRLKPDYATAYYNRGLAREDKGDLDGALRDYDEAIRLNLDGALRDYDEAIRLSPDADAYYKRGNVRRDKGDLEGALRDYDEAIRLKPDFDSAYYNRGRLYKKKGERQAAITNYQKYLDLGGGIRDGDQAKVEKIIRDLKKR